MNEPDRQATVSQTRAAQILTAAADLLLRHGYGRITMEDVARQAGVGTGTLYLHWKTKEALFETVLLRELVAIWDGLARLLDANPADAVLHHFLGHLLRGVKERPLAQALFTRNSALLGKLALRSEVLQTQPATSSIELITMLRELGLMRSDIALGIQAHAFSVVWAGFSLVDPLLTGEQAVTLETQIAALALVMRHTFEPERLPDDETLRDVVAPALRVFLAQAQAAFEQHIQARMLSAR